MIKRIIVFDLGGVFFNNGLKVALEKISKKFGLDTKIVEFVLNGSFSEEYRTGKIDTEKFWENAKNYLEIRNIEEIRKIFFESYYPHKKTAEFIEKLKRNGFKIAFLSNSPSDRAKYLDKEFNFINIFDFGLFSFEAHFLKPEKKIYKRFLEKYNLTARDIIYVDDKEENLKPAKELGMKTIIFKDIAQLKNELKEEGIKLK